MSYYRGDYYRGDFWGGLAKGVRRVARDVGRTVKAVAPLAGFVLPGIAPLGLLGKGLTVASKVKKIGRGIQMLKGAALQRSSVAPAPWGTPVLMASQLTGQTVGIPSAAPIENPLAAEDRSERAAAARPYRKRRTVKRRKKAAPRRARARNRAGYRRRKSTTRRRRYA